MLRAMTISGAAVGLLLAAGVALGVLLALLLPAALDRRRGRLRMPPSPPQGYPDDDLPGFLATPPGSDGQPAVPRSGWAVLSAPPGPPPAPVLPARPRIGRAALIAGLAALVLLTAGVAVVVTSADPRRPVPAPKGREAGGAARLPAVPTAPAPGAPGAGALAGADLPTGRHGVTADLTFTGIVLERRAVGVTAAYPHVRISDDGSASLAHVELLTFNCLTDAAPADPVAAGCRRVVPEYAELPSPALQMTRSRAGGLALRGRFPTYHRPNGTPAVWTGEVYELRIEVSPTTAERPGTTVPVTGFLQLGEDRARTAAVSVLRPGR
jgi:hypothetical protein